MIQVKFKKVDPNAQIPQISSAGDAGMDLFSVDEKILRPGERALIKTGIAIELPQNTEAQIRPRSGLALKNGITVLNTPGTIDEGYRGEIGVILINLGNEDFSVNLHMRIAQLVIKPIYEIEIIETNILSESDRGERGFGSSGLT